MQWGEVKGEWGKEMQRLSGCNVKQDSHGKSVGENDT